MNRIPAVLAPVTYVPGLIFEALVRVRSRTYATGILRRDRLPATVISIGNITMGGTGKTPLVIYVARLLSDLGCSPAILTRGYGRIHPGTSHILAPGEIIESPALTIGDEPALIRRRVPSAWMGVSKNRFMAGSILSKKAKRMVFVLDDGFQHCQLHRDLDIVIIDASRPLGSNRIFPRGTLREPISALRRCDAVVINGPLDSPEVRTVEGEIQRLGIGAQIFHCRQYIRSLSPFLSWERAASIGSKDSPGDRFSDTRPSAQPRFPSAYLVGALGNPDRFRRDIRQLGIEGPGSKFFPDHHRLSRRDWRHCAETARREGAETMITTEKDAVKISQPPDFPLLVAEQTTELAEAKAFELVIQRTLEEHV